MCANHFFRPRCGGWYLKLKKLQYTKFYLCARNFRKISESLIVENISSSEPVIVVWLLNNKSLDKALLQSLVAAKQFIGG